MRPLGLASWDLERRCCDLVEALAEPFPSDRAFYHDRSMLTVLAAGGRNCTSALNWLTQTLKTVHELFNVSVLLPNDQANDRLDLIIAKEVEPSAGEIGAVLGKLLSIWDGDECQRAKDEIVDAAYGSTAPDPDASFSKASRV